MAFFPSLEFCFGCWYFFGHILQMLPRNVTLTKVGNSCVKQCCLSPDVTAASVLASRGVFNQQFVFACVSATSGRDRCQLPSSQHAGINCYCKGEIAFML